VPIICGHVAATDGRPKKAEKNEKEKEKGTSALDQMTRKKKFDEQRSPNSFQLMPPI
jgi:hypothetical protein